MSKKDLKNQFELEKQLHEQYAINNNSNLASIIAILTALIGIFAVYGYVFIHSSLEFAESWGDFFNGNKIYSLDVLLLATSASQIVIAILFYLSAYMGTNQRKEQFITYAIRNKVYKRIKIRNNFLPNEKYDAIFPKSYNPINKTIYDFIQGLYGEICKILQIIFILISSLTVFKLFIGIVNSNDFYGKCCVLWFLIVYLICLIISYFVYSFLFQKGWIYWIIRILFNKISLILILVYGICLACNIFDINIVYYSGNKSAIWYIVSSFLIYSTSIISILFPCFICKFFNEYIEREDVFLNKKN